MHSPAARQDGFSLIELAMVVLVMGLLLAIGIPAYHAISRDQQVGGAAQTVAFQLQLGRMRAQATGVTQTVTFDKSSSPPIVGIEGGTSSSRWTLPKGVTFATGSADTFQYFADGRASSSQYVILQTSAGLVDTVSVQSSGLVLVR